jgi:integrase
LQTFRLEISDPPLWTRCRLQSREPVTLQLALHRILHGYDPEQEHSCGVCAGRHAIFTWCERHRVHTLDRMTPIVIAAYVENHPMAAPTMKQHLVAIRMLFDFLVTGQIVQMNPASSVRGPKHVVHRGKSPVLKADQTRVLLDLIKIDSFVGLRDRAIVGLTCHTFARVSATVNLKTEDYYQNGNAGGFACTKKVVSDTTSRRITMPNSTLDAYLDAAGIRDERKTPLFRSVDKKRNLTANPMTRTDVLRMVKRRAIKAGLPSSTCCHTFRATGITAYLENRGTIENAQVIAAHQSPRTTKLYDRTSDDITLDEVEQIAIWSGSRFSSIT